MKLYFTIFLILISATISHAKEWQNIKTIQDLCNTYPQNINRLFDYLNLDYSGLEQVKAAKEENNIVLACHELLKYYQNSNSMGYLRAQTPKVTNATFAAADTILTNTFTIQTVKGKVPYLANGHRDWAFRGPNNDHEWAWLSNRHHQLDTVYQAYMNSGNIKYAQYIDLFLKDFITASFPYPAKRSGTAIWRGLEVSFRIKSWSKIFYGMINNPNMSPVTKLLILSSIPDHGDYNRNFHAQNNWLTMEISALATVGANFPEFKQSQEWLNYAIKTMQESMEKQLYPDGTQVELTAHYHDVALSNFEIIKELCDHSNTPIPQSYIDALISMYNYTSNVMRPNGYRPHNNDGDLVSVREFVTKGAESYNRADWKYIATNGKEGKKPKGAPSYFAPWAGHLVSRSGYEADAHWSFFDIGPLGAAHTHNDKLHISISAYGRDLLVDAGRFAYTGDIAKKFRWYAIGSRAHNVIIFDDREQMPGPLFAKEPISNTKYKITKKYDIAKGSFNKYQGISGEVKHSRTLYYERDKMWIVIDSVNTDRPRKVNTFWHFHPSCKVTNDNEKIYTSNQRGNIAVIPVESSTKWNVELIKGQEKPHIQGWYSREYSSFEPNIVADYSTNINSNARFIWVLVPSEDETHNIKAEIVSENRDEIKIRVILNKKRELITIPLNAISY